MNSVVDSAWKFISLLPLHNFWTIWLWLWIIGQVYISLTALTWLQMSWAALVLSQVNVHFANGMQNVTKSWVFCLLSFMLFGSLTVVGKNGGTGKIFLVSRVFRELGAFSSSPVASGDILGGKIGVWGVLPLWRAGEKRTYAVVSSDHETIPRVCHR